MEPNKPVNMSSGNGFVDEELTRKPSTGKISSGIFNRWKSSPLFRSYRYLAPYWPLVAGIYGTMLGIVALNIAIPQFIRWIVDTGIRQQDKQVLLYSALGLLGLTLVRSFLAFFQGRWSEVASQNVAYDIRNELQRKLTFLSFSFHDQAETGELLSRTIQDVERIRFLTGRATLRVMEGSFLLVGYSVTLLLMNARLAVLVILTLPFLVYRALTFGRRYRPLSYQTQKQLAVLTTQVEQNLRGSQVVKAFAQEKAEIERFEVENERWFSLSALGARLQSINIPILFLIANIGTLIIIWYGGRLVITHSLTLGELVAFTTYVALLVDPVRRLGMIIPAIAMASTASERVYEILDSVSEVKDDPQAKTLPAITGRVKFENVTFGYHGRNVLKGIDIEVEPGQVVALLGPTGSGKSTAVHLIPRFYDVTGGRVTIDGIDIRSVTLNSLRSQIGIVLQETTLFAATIRENIAFGRADAAQAEIEAAAKAAQAHEFIMQLPDGYDTPVGERGVTLSGGQKQRLALARVMVLDPHILILDDATASVDAETEHQIQMALERVMQGRTSFVIAHRMSTVRTADLILVLESGRIHARGTHAELLEISPLYRDIYTRQLAPMGDAQTPDNQTPGLQAPGLQTLDGKGGRQ